MPKESKAKQGEAGESGDGLRPVTPLSSPVDTETGTSPTPVAKGEDDKNSPPRQFADDSTHEKTETTSRGSSQISKEVDVSTKPIPEGAEDNKGPFRNEAEKSGVTPPALQVDTGTGAGPTPRAQGEGDKNSPPRPFTDAATNAVSGTTNRTTSPTRQDVNASETTSPASPVDQGTETSPASLGWLASTTGTQTSPVPDGPAGLMSELAGKSPAVNETGKSGDGSDVDFLSSPDDQGTETSSEALGAASTGSQTTLVTESIRPMPKESKAKQGEAGESGDGLRPVTLLSSPVDTETGTSPTPVAKGEDDKNSPPRQFADDSTHEKTETTSRGSSQISKEVDVSTKPIPEGAEDNKGPFRNEAEKSGVTPPASQVDTGTGAGPTPRAQGEGDKNSPPRPFTDAATNAVSGTTNRTTSPTRQDVNASISTIPEGAKDNNSSMPVALGVSGGNTTKQVLSELTALRNKNPWVTDDSTSLIPKVITDSGDSATLGLEQSNGLTPKTLEVPDKNSPLREFADTSIDAVPETTNRVTGTTRQVHADLPGPMPEEIGERKSPVGAEAGKSGDESRPVTTTSSAVDTKVETSAKPAASGMTATDSQTSATDDSPSQTPEEIGERQSPVGAEAGQSGDESRPVTTPSSAVDTKVETSAKLAGSGMTATDSQTSATDDSPSQTPEEIGERQSPVGAEAGKSGDESRPVTTTSSAVDTKVETSAKPAASGMTATDSQTSATDDSAEV